MQMKPKYADHPTFRRCLLSNALFTCLVLASLMPLRGFSGELVAYSTIEPEEAHLYKEAFERAYPDITLKIVRSSAGTMTARLFAEKSNPRNDVIFRTSNTTLILLGKQGLLHPYQPRGYQDIDPKFKDKINDPPIWTGTDAYVDVLCYNTIEAKKLGLPEPKAWADLVKPIYSGHIVAPNTEASGTGFIAMAAWIHLWGEQKAFEYMDALDRNIKYYLNSGSAPCTKAASGEVAIGLSWDVRAAELAEQGAPIKVIYPAEGLGWDMEGSAIMKAAETRGRLEDAEKFMDWLLTPPAMKIHNQLLTIIAREDLPEERRRSLRKELMSDVVDYDFVWNAENRNRLIDEWSKRYGGGKKN